MKKWILPIAAASILTGCIVHIDTSHASAPFQKQETIKLDAATLKKLVVDSGAGSLTILGEDRNDIVLVADIYHKEGVEYTLSLEEFGNKAKLNAQFESRFSGNNKINLSVKVPSSLALDIDDGSGSIEIKNVNNDVNIEDGSGSIEIINAGDITLDDGSGSIYIADSKNVTIEDGSGNITVRNVTGSVKIDDGSGNIDVNGADSFRLIDDGSGNVNTANIKNAVSLPK